MVVVGVAHKLNILLHKYSKITKKLQIQIKIKRKKQQHKIFLKIKEMFNNNNWLVLLINFFLQMILDHSTIINLTL